MPPPALFPSWQAEYAAAVRESYQLLQGAVTAINDALDEVGGCCCCTLPLSFGIAGSGAEVRPMSHRAEQLKGHTRVTEFPLTSHACSRCRRCGRRNKSCWSSS